MKKIFKVLVIAAVVALSIVADWSFVSESLKLSDTCLLWVNGRFAGWIEIVLFCVLMDVLISIPAIMMWDSINDMEG